MSDVTIVKTLTGHKHIININDMKTVKDIKEYIQMKEGITIDQIKFITDGKQITDEIPAETIKQKTLHMILSLRGGARSKKSSKKKSKKGSRKGSDESSDESFEKCSNK